MRQWYRFENKADGTEAELFIYDVIGASLWEDTISAKQFIDELQALPENVKALRVRINSPGGDPFDATAIANALRNWASKDGRTVETIVDGLAASAASIVAMAGSKVVMADNALMMVHDPWTLAIGNAAEMRKMADTLDSIRDSIVATYRWHADLSDDEIKELMADETWMDADDAITYGFATEKTEGLKAAALLDPKALAKLTIPEKFKARVEAFTKKPEPEQRPVAAPAVDVLSLCEDAGVIDIAKELIAAGATLDQVHARIASEKQAREAKAAYETGVRAKFKVAGISEAADAFLNRDVETLVQIIAAKLDKVEIDANLDPDHGVVNAPATWKRAFEKANAHRRVTTH